MDEHAVSASNDQLEDHHLRCIALPFSWNEDIKVVGTYEIGKTIALLKVIKTLDL